MNLAHSTLHNPQRSLQQQHAADLRPHLMACRAGRGRWHRMAALVERAHGVVAPRFITTVGVLCALLALALGWL